MESKTYQPQKKRIYGLDLVRAVAICLVLLSHGRYLIQPHIEWASNLRVFGFIGVELFFVLSGFLISNILIRDRFYLSSLNYKRQFIQRRWLRTLPNYFLFLLVNIAIYYLVLNSPVNWSSYFLFLQNL